MTPLRLVVNLLLGLLGLFLMWQIPTLTRKGRGALRQRAQGPGQWTDPTAGCGAPLGDHPGQE